MIKIRLSRLGKRNDPFYRVVAIEHTRKRGGKPLEILGYWHPAKNKKTIDVKKIEAWVKKGAKISKGVNDLIKKTK